MSDEPVPPSLRLKPRQPTPVVPPAEAAAEPLPAEPASPPLNDPLKLRLKPKAPPPEGSPADASGLPFPTPAPFSSPPLPTPPTAASPVPVEMPSPAPVMAKSIPVVPPTPPVAAFSPPKPQYVPTPRGLTDSGSPSSTQPAAPAIKADKWLAGLVLFVLVLAGAFYGIRVLSKSHPKAQSHAAAAPALATPAVPQTESAQNAPKLVDNPTSAAGKAIAKARDVVAAHDKMEKEQGVTSILEEPSATAATQVPVSASAAPAKTELPAAVPVAAQPEPPPEPSAAFRDYVTHLKVSGVFQGEPARALINGKMVRLGDVLEPNRKIELYKIDPDAKQLIFRDATGAIMPRHY